MLECLVCLEYVCETELALPACAHPVCGHCIGNVLDGASVTRDAPTCREILRRSEITFLVEASDTGTASKIPAERHGHDEDSKPPAVHSENGFRVTKADVHVSVTGASTLRAGRCAMSDTQLSRALNEDRALLPTLKERFLASNFNVEAKMEPKSPKAYDLTSKCVVSTNSLVSCIHSRGRATDAWRQFCSLINARELTLFRNSLLIQTSRFFLLLMPSGAVGLTLTAAGHCFIMDIAQNSAIGL
jgi:hypothetical protein